MDITYREQRRRIEHYFDRTAAKTWAQLTSDAPVSRIRATVRAGRDEMRNTLLSWLPPSLDDATVLDAGCGTGALAIEAAKRGANVLGVDLSASLIQIARERARGLEMRGKVEFASGDMIDNGRRFDYIVAMDSIIHYEQDPMLDVLSALAAQANRAVLFTVAPYSPLLAAMKAAGKLFPRADRSPAIVPIRTRNLYRQIDTDSRFSDWTLQQSCRVHRGFYVSHAQEIRK